MWSPGRLSSKQDLQGACLAWSWVVCMAIPQGQGRGCLHGEMMPSIPGPQDQVLNANYKEQSWEDSGTHGSATQAIAPLATRGPCSWMDSDDIPSVKNLKAWFPFPMPRWNRYVIKNPLVAIYCRSSLFSFGCWRMGKTSLVGFLSFSPCVGHDLTFSGRTVVQARPCRVGFAASVSKYFVLFRWLLNQQCLLIFNERKQKRYGHSRKTQPCLNIPIIDCLPGSFDFASCRDATFEWRTFVSNPGPGPEPSWQGWFHQRPQLLAPTVCQMCTAVGRKSQKWVTTRVGLVQVIHSLMKSLPTSCCLWDMGRNTACAWRGARHSSCIQKLPTWGKRQVHKDLKDKAIFD